MDQVLKRFELIEARMAAGPEPDEYVRLASEYADLQEIAGQDPRAAQGAKPSATTSRPCWPTRRPTPRCARWPKTSCDAVEERIEALPREIQVLLLPKDAADERNAILEIRAGTGGDEAALFAGDLFRMYERYASRTGLEDRGRCRRARARSAATRRSSPTSRARACSPG